MSRKNPEKTLQEQFLSGLDVIYDEYRQGLTQNQEHSLIVVLRSVVRQFEPSLLSYLTDEQTISFSAGFDEKLNHYLCEYHYHLNDDFSDKYITPKILEIIFIHYLPYPQKDLGTYYTSDKIVDEMCQRSLYACLKSGNADEDQRLWEWIHLNRTKYFESHSTEKENILDQIKTLKIYDPSAGCGAFPVGMMKLLTRCISSLEPETSLYEIRKNILFNQLYGSDIEKIALTITKIRLLLSLFQTASSSDFLALKTELHFDVSDSLISERYSDGFFDIVLGNPPYGVKLNEQTKKIYKSKYPRLERRFDIYMAFFELGIKLSHHILCYITPDKWLSKSFGLRFREECMMPYMTEVIQYGDDFFDKALVDAIVFVMDLKNQSDKLSFCTCCSDFQISRIRDVDKNQIISPYVIDPYFKSKIPEEMTCIEKCTHRLGEFIQCEFVCVNPADAYILKPLISENDKPDETELKMLTTGTIGKFHPLWGKKSMKFLRDSYQHPVVLVDDLKNAFGEGFVKKVSSPKILLKGLNLLDASLDLEGRFMSHVGTLMIQSESEDLLCLVAALLNSDIVSRYFKFKYISSSYCGGLLFTPAMIMSLPVPDLSFPDVYRPIIDEVRGSLSTETNFKILAEIETRIYGV